MIIDKRKKIAEGELEKLLQRISIKEKVNVCVEDIKTVQWLGPSFLAGSFINQELLSDQVLTASKVFPSYWFIKNNEYISTNSIDKLYYNNIFIMIGFIILFTLISFLVRKFKMSQSQARQ